MAYRNLLMALIGGLLIWLASSAIPGDTAAAQCCAPPPPCCTPPPPPCCTPPTPPPCCTPPAPPPRPPIPPNCCTAGGRTNIIVNSNAVAVSVSGAGAGAGAIAYGGGGGGGYYSPPVATGVIQGLDVQGVHRTRQVAYEASRTRSRRVVIQAFCLDDRDIPHPASQVFPERDVEDAYDGELYRCIAGARMQVTIAEWVEQISFSGGQTMICAKGEALYRSRGSAADAGQLVCRPQKPARDCNERSLLRRFGAGIKVLTIVTMEKYTAYREETVTESTASSYSMSLDGGVGGTVY
ncbi:MAG: hypothetical protein ACOYM5_01425 [Caulobacter sp.]